MRRRVLLAVLAGGALAPAAAAQHAGHEMPAVPAGPGVSIGYDAFAPVATEVLTGDTVTWTNGSARAHDVSAADATWDSGRMPAGAVYAHRFEAAGKAAYFCRLHPFMTGEIGVYDLLLDHPAAAAGAGRPYPLAGRAALPAGTPVTIEADSGAGFAPAGSATVGPDGTFAATIVPDGSQALRAVAGDAASPPVQLLVLDRSLKVAARRISGHRLRVDATVTPAAPGSTVVLQLKLKDRFGWWPVRTARLDASSHARLVTRLRRRVPARVVLTLPDGATVLATSRTQRRY